MKETVQIEVWIMKKLSGTHKNYLEFGRLQWQEHSIYVDVVERDKGETQARVVIWGSVILKTGDAAQCQVLSCCAGGPGSVPSNPPLPSRCEAGGLGVRSRENWYKQASSAKMLKDLDQVLDCWQLPYRLHGSNFPQCYRHLTLQASWVSSFLFK